MAKVKIRYSLYNNNTGYFTKYRQKTIDISLPKNDYGNILFKTLLVNCQSALFEKLSEKFNIINYQIVD